MHKPVGAILDRPPECRKQSGRTQFAPTEKLEVFHKPVGVGLLDDPRSAISTEQRTPRRVILEQSEESTAGKGGKHLLLCHPERANKGEPKDLTQGKRPRARENNACRHDSQRRSFRRPDPSLRFTTLEDDTFGVGGESPSPSLCATSPQGRGFENLRPLRNRIQTRRGRPRTTRDPRSMKNPCSTDYSSTASGPPSLTREGL